MSITHLRVKSVGPFDEIEFEFDEQVNVFTGPNNSGKSSALFVLADALVYPFNFPSKLLRPEETATFEIQASGSFNGTFQGELPAFMRLRTSNSDGYEGFWTPERSRAHLSFLKEIGFSKFIPALRLSTDFVSKGPTSGEQNDSLDDIRAAPRNFNDLWRGHLDLFRMSRRLRENEGDEDLRKRLGLLSNNATLVSDEQVIQTIIEWDYRSYLRKQPELRNTLVRVGEIAKEITDGFIIGFDSVSEYGDGFVPEFQTEDGTLPVNTLSQGTQSVIQWLSHLLISYAEYYDFPNDLAERPGVFIVDEIDVHLHPSWQRRIIPTLIGHFPKLQVFCSTHSPLMLAGLKDGQVQLLERKRDGKITVSRNEEDILGWTADEILRNFLGISDPTDMKTVEHLAELERLENLESRTAAESAKLDSLRSVVSQRLLSGPTAAKELDEFAEMLSALDKESKTLQSDPTDRQGE